MLVHLSLMIIHHHVQNINGFENELLEPGGYSSYNLKAKFNQPGIYNLNRYRFIVQTHSNDINSIKKTNPSKIFFFPTQHLIVVGTNQSSSSASSTS